MKIDSNFDSPAVSGTPAVQAKTVRDAAARPAPGSPAATPPTQDRVELSAAGATISGLDGAGDFDKAKVESIRQAIREGRFSVNADAIADRLLAEAKALLGPRSH